MKKSIIFIFLFMVVCVIQSQIQDLNSLASGTLKNGEILYDSNDNVYGYIYLYDQGDIDKQTTKLEYVFLDKNLNKVSNNTFNVKKIEKRYTISYSFFNMDEDNVVLSRFQRDQGYTKFFVSYQFISLKKSTVSEEFIYEDGEFKELGTKFNNKLKSIGHISVSINRKNKGFFVTEYDYKKENIQNKYLKYYNVDRELQWTYEYNLNAKIVKYRNLKFLSDADNTIYFLETFRGTYPKEYKIIAFNKKTGQKNYEYVFENKENIYSHSLNVKEIDDKLVLTGNYSKLNLKKDFNLDKNLGFYRIVLDKNGSEVEKKYTSWENFSGVMDIDKNGRVEKNYRLRPIKFFMFKDGTICILTEKYKPAKNGIYIPIPIIGEITQASTKQNEKTTDFVLFFMNKDFSVNKTHTIQKDLSKVYNHDYLFSQYIKNDTGAVFFFKDYRTEDKNWILGVNTILKGEVKEERIPMTSTEDKSTIVPMIAKEGYVILKEYNETEKYNQIRLEKLN